MRLDRYFGLAGRTALVAAATARFGQINALVCNAGIPGPHGAGMRGNRDVGLYGITKAALIQLARNLAVEWGPAGVRANAIAPGLVRTAWAANVLANPEAAERRLSMTPLRRIAEPWEIAGATLFLAGPDGRPGHAGAALVVTTRVAATDFPCRSA